MKSLETQKSLNKWMLGLGVLGLSVSASAFDYGEALKGVLNKNNSTATTPAAPAAAHLRFERTANRTVELAHRAARQHDNRRPGATARDGDPLSNRVRVLQVREGCGTQWAAPASAAGAVPLVPAFQPR